MHDIKQGFLTHPEYLDELRCLVALLLYKQRGLAFTRSGIGTLHIVLTECFLDLQLRDVVEQRQRYVAALDIHSKVGHDVTRTLLGRVTAYEASRLGIQRAYHRHCVTQVFLRYVERGTQPVVMLLREEVEIVSHNLACGPHRHRIILAFQLNQQAVAQVDSPDSGRVESAHKVEHLPDLTGGDMTPRLGLYVVAHRPHITPQIAVVVKIAYDILSHGELRVVKIMLGKLRHQGFKQCRRRVDSHRLVIGVGCTVVACFKAIGRNLVLRAVVGELHVLGRLIEVAFLVLRLLGHLKRRVVVEGVLNLILHLGSVHFKHPDKTHLKRRKLLLQFLLQ